jgi:alpha-beta hydrolase superfamily lysophospholipase
MMPEMHERFKQDRIERLTCGDGKQRKIHIWEAEKPAKVFLTVHGGMDHGGNYCLPALYFREHGIATVVLDQRGHDHHGPDHPTRVIFSRFEDFLEDLDLMLDWVKKEFKGLPVYILAHSMGGLIATHWGIRHPDRAAEVKGFMLSSPYYVNVIKTPALARKLAGILSELFPKMKLPLESFLEVVTHDQEITARHKQDEADGFMAKESSFRFAAELLKAQQWIPGNISRWNHPALIIVAGDDQLADASATRELIGGMDPALVSEQLYPQNYHENFNELNRKEIFERILKWVGDLEEMDSKIIRQSI